MQASFKYFDSKGADGAAAQSASSDAIDHVRTAAGVLCLLEGNEVPIRDLLRGLASEPQLDAMAKQLAEGDRSTRAKILASYLAHLAVELDRWSL